jgi:uncharacterized protein (UPF0332 family)
MLNPEHLIELAQQEIHSQSTRPRQAVLRRAVSTSYYAVFHGLLQQVAGSFVPDRSWKAHVLFYRALEHTKTRERCRRAGQNPLPKEEAAFFEFPRFPEELRFFADSFVDLQRLRHSCDYDPEFVLAKSEAQEAVASAQETLIRLRNADPESRRLFLAYLLFGLRG